MARELLRRRRVHRGFRRHAARGLRGSATRRASTRRRGAGQIKNFTGIDSPYEAPEKPELKLDTRSNNPEALVEELLVELRRRHLV